MNTLALLSAAPLRDQGLEAGLQAKVFEFACVAVAVWAGAWDVFMSVREGACARECVMCVCGGGGEGAGGSREP